MARGHASPPSRQGAQGRLCKSRCHSHHRPYWLSPQAQLSTALTQVSYDLQHGFSSVVHAAVRVRQARHPPCENHGPSCLGVFDIRHDGLVVDLHGGDGQPALFRPTKTIAAPQRSRDPPVDPGAGEWPKTARTHGSLSPGVVRHRRCILALELTVGIFRIFCARMQ